MVECHGCNGRGRIETGCSLLCIKALLDKLAIVNAAIYRHKYGGPAHREKFP